MPTTMHPDDMTTTEDVRLWDAGEGVCCAAFQLGACAHTEAFDADEAFSDTDSDYELADYLATQGFTSCAARLLLDRMDAAEAARLNPTVTDEPF